jgi:hypothetical protein
MKARHRSAAEALRFVLDDLEASLVEAPDDEIVEATRGCWMPGYQAAPVREVVREALQVDWRTPITLAPLAGRGWLRKAQPGEGYGGAARIPSPGRAPRAHPLPKRGEGK